MMLIDAVRLRRMQTKVSVGKTMRLGSGLMAKEEGGGGTCGGGVLCVDGLHEA